MVHTFKCKVCPFKNVFSAHAFYSIEQLKRPPILCIRRSLGFCTLSFSSVIVVQQNNDEILTRYGYVTEGEGEGTLKHDVYTDVS